MWSNLVLFFELLGALGLFLFGMKVMSDALLKLAGNRMRSVLAGLTSNRFKGIGTGFLITSVIQSSSATSLMVVSFANAALLSLPQAFSVIMGANIGTTITAWLITLVGFKVSLGAMALPVVGIGFITLLSKKEKWQQLGSFVVGFGLLFLGLDLLQTYLPDLNAHPATLAFIQHYTAYGFGSVLLFLLIGTLLTIVLQSSSATMALTLVMSASGWIPLELAAAMVLGENIGTTITANLAALVGNYRAKQTALAHVLFNAFGLLWMLFLLSPILKGISWSISQLGGISPIQSSQGVPVAIAIFHSVFNIANTLILVGLLHPLSRFIQWVIPARQIPVKALEEPKFLNEQALNYPQTAIEAIEQETKYLFEHAVVEIIAHALNLHRTEIYSSQKAGQVVQQSRQDLKTDVRGLYLTKVKRIYSLIISYATRAQSRLQLTEPQHRRISELKQANRHLVDLIRYATDLNRNVSAYLNSDEHIMLNQYDVFRVRLIKTLREIEVYQITDDVSKRASILNDLENWAQTQSELDNSTIDTLIREDGITPEMASSLLNDSYNLSEMFNNLFRVIKLIY